MKSLSSKKIILIVLFVLVITGVIIFVKYDNKNRNRPVSRTNISTNNTNHQTGVFPTSFTINGLNGEAHVIGVKVNAVLANTISASGLINNVSVSFIINTDKQTTIKGAVASSSPKTIKVGDTIFVTGTFQSFTPQITVLAKEVRIISSISF